MISIHRTVVLACTTSVSLLAGIVALTPTPSVAASDGVTQVAGDAVLATVGDAPCDDAAHAGADYALAMTGDLVGCIYGTITHSAFHPSGTYQERADEVFVGDYGALSGTFGLTEHFTAKFDTDTFAQIFGRCQHPIVDGSGTGDFSGVGGRLDFKDDVNAGTAAYRGHLSLD